MLYLVSVGEMLLIRTQTDVGDLLISTLVLIPVLFLFTASILPASDNEKKRRSLLARNLSTGLCLHHRPIL